MSIAQYVTIGENYFPGIMTWIINYIGCFIMDVITHSCYDFIPSALEFSRCGLVRTEITHIGQGCLTDLKLQTQNKA